MAKSDYEISPFIAYREAAATVLRQQVKVMMDNLPGTRAGDDIEALHDMRVASRRLRAALSIFADAFPPKPFQKLEKQASDVTDALGTVRDADVLIEFVTGSCERASPVERVGMEDLLSHLQKQRDKDRVLLVKALDKLETSSFLEDFNALVGTARGECHG